MVDPALRALWLRYLSSERSGVRTTSLSVLDEMLHAAITPIALDELAVLALRALESRRLATLRHPLRTNAVLPYLQSHISDPQAIWWTTTTLRSGLDTYDLLQRYAAYDPLAKYEDDLAGDCYAGAFTYALALTGEARWWRRLLETRLWRVSDGTHHLDEGIGLVDGSDRHYLVQMCAAVAIWAQAPDGVLTAAHVAELEQEWQLLRDWFLYDGAGRPGGDFSRWCHERGSTHWVVTTAGTQRHYYY